MVMVDGEVGRMQQMNSTIDEWKWKWMEEMDYFWESSGNGGGSPLSSAIASNQRRSGGGGGGVIGQRGTTSYDFVFAV